MKYVNKECQDLKRAKGVRKATLQRDVTFTDYYDVYKLIKTDLSKSQIRIASKKHNVSTIHYYKKALSVWEDKRSWISENSSLPYGNHKLENQTLPAGVNLPRQSVPKARDLLLEENADACASILPHEDEAIDFDDLLSNIEWPVTPI